MKHVKILSDSWGFSPFDKSQITYLRQKNHTVVLHSSSSFVESRRSQAVKNCLPNSTLIPLGVQSFETNLD